MKHGPLYKENFLGKIGRICAPETSRRVLLNFGKQVEIQLIDSFTKLGNKDFLKEDYQKSSKILAFFKPSSFI